MNRNLWQSIHHGQDDRFRRRRKARLEAALIPPTRPADGRAPPPPVPAPPTAGRVGNLTQWTRTIEPDRRDRRYPPRGATEADVISNQAVGNQAVVASLRAQRIELPSWAFGNSGTRFKVFAQKGVPRDP